MDLSRYELKDLILTALKSEVDAEQVYLKIGESVKNFMLSDRFKFLADEERKHAGFFRDYFQRQFPGEPIEIPDECPVPLPKVKIESETIPISDVIAMAMAAEKAASEFYTSMAEQLPAEEAQRSVNEKEGRSTVKGLLIYIASMEMGHYRLLEIEEQNAKENEQYEIIWNMTHLGP
jgi:rubrerythrin